MKLRNHSKSRTALLSGAALLGVTALSVARPLSMTSGGVLLTPSPAASGDASNPLSFAGGALTLDIEARLRAESRRNNYLEDASGLPPKEVTNDEWLLSRLRIGALWKPCSAFRIYVQGQDSREFGSDRPDVPGNAYGAEGYNAFDLRQAWAEFGDAKIFPLTVKVGRQTLSYGDDRLIGLSDWNNLARAFDAAKLRWQEKDWSVDAFVATPVDYGDLRQFDQSDLFNGREKHRNQILAGIYGSTTAVGPQTTDLYVLHLSDRSPGNGHSSFFTFGTRMKSKPGAFAERGADGKPRPVGFDYSGEFAYQRGEVCLNSKDYLTSVTAKTRDLEAFGFNVGAGYTFDEDLKPRVGVQYTYASGDRDPGDDRTETFQNLFPTNHKFYGGMDMFSWRNMQDLQADFKLNPTKDITLKAEYHAFWAASTDDVLYRASTKALTSVPQPDSGAFAGSEVDVVATWNVSKPLQLEAGYSHFFAGPYLRRASGERAPDADFGYLQMKVAF